MHTREQGKRFGRKTFAELYSPETIAAFQAARYEEGLNIKDALAKLDIPKSTYLKYRDIFEAAPVDDIGGADDPE